MPTQPPWLNPSSPTGPATAGCLRSTASASRSSAARSSRVWVRKFPGDPPQPGRSWVSTTAPSSAIRSAQPPQSSQQPSPEPSTSTSAATGSSGTCTSARSSPTDVHSVLSIRFPSATSPRCRRRPRRSGRAGEQDADEPRASSGRVAGSVSRSTYGSSTARSSCRSSPQLGGGDRQRRPAHERRVLPLGRLAVPAPGPGEHRSASRWMKTRSSWSVIGPDDHSCSSSVSRQSRSRRPARRRLLHEPVLGQLPEVERAARLAHPEVPPAPGRRRGPERRQRLDQVEPERVRQRPYRPRVRDPHDAKAIFDISECQRSL